MPLIPIAMALAQFAPSLLQFFGAGEPTQAVAQKVVEIAQVVTGAKTPEEALSTMQASADAQAAFHMAALNQVTDLEKLASAERLSNQAEVTKRLQADMSSDSWLSKNIRPLALIYLLMIVTLQGFGLMTIESGFLDTIREFTGYVLKFYFCGRTLEKVVTTAVSAYAAKKGK